MISSTFLRGSRPRHFIANSSLGNGFSLVEIAIVLTVLAILSASLLTLISNQAQIRQREVTRRLLDESREAILAFSAAQGRLPCPASASSKGLESFCLLESGSCAESGTTVVQTHGNCSNFYDGFLPAASLGLSPLDEEGYLRDAWGGGPSSRIRYAVHDAQIDAIAHVLTGSERIRRATMSAVVGTGTPVTYLYVCSTLTGSSNNNSCGTGPGAKQLASNIPAIIFSLGPNGSTESGGKSFAERENLDGDRVFVAREPTGAPDDFDDLVTWISLLAIFDRLMRSGQLP